MSKINVFNNCEIRTSENGDLVINGLLPTESYSEVMFNVKKRIFFKEIISRGAFDVILEKVRPKLIINHDYDKELTLKNFKAKESTKGLEFEAIISTEGEFTKEVKENIGKINGLSYGFVCGVDRYISNGDRHIRRIYSFADLMEISILIGRQPCYSATEVTIVPAGVKSQLTELEQYKLWLREEQIKILKEKIENIKIKK